MLVIFASLLAAALQFINRQSHATILQEQTEQAFAAAEGGLHHVVWLLNSGEEAMTTLPGILNEPMTNSAGETVATFFLSFSGVSASSITVTAVGRDGGVPDICQVIIARVVASPAGGYSLSDWNHQGGADCASAPGASASSPGIVTTSIALDTPQQTVDKSFSAQDLVHRYMVAGKAGQQVQFKVKSNAFTPTLVLKDSAGTAIAYAGQEWQLAHVRYQAAVLAWRENMTAFIGRPPVDDVCRSSVYTACIPRDATTWLTLPEDGLYQLEITSIDDTRGDYSLTIAVY